jgi:hypothetical protein
MKLITDSICSLVFLGGPSTESCDVLGLMDGRSSRFGVPELKRKCMGCSYILVLNDIGFIPMIVYVASGRCEGAWSVTKGETR